MKNKKPFKISQKDIDKIYRKIRRDEHVELAPVMGTKVVKSKKIYSRKGNKKWS